jgi:hypothetical protein
VKPIIFVVKLLFLRKLQQIKIYMKIPQPKLSVLAILTVLMLFGMSSCERIHNNSDTREETAADFAMVITELGSILEFADESSDQTNGKGAPLFFNLQNFSKDTRIYIIDSTFYDGDPVEFTIDFGPNTQPLRPSQKCLDGRFRGGKVKVVLESHYIENTSKSHVLVENGSEFVFGTESKVFIVHHLEIDVERKMRELLSFNIKHLELDDKHMELEGTLTAEKITGITTPGVFGDHYQLGGDGKAEINDEEFKWNIGSPLIKKLEPGCGMIPVKGLLNLTIEKTNRDILLDFDPFNNESCDRILRITNAGKATDIVLD